MVKYYTISLAENLVKQIDEIKEKNGFSSRADFVKQSIRLALKELKQ